MPVGDSAAEASRSTDASQQDATTPSPSSDLSPNPEEPTTGPLYWEKRRAEWLREKQRPAPVPVDDNVPGSKARARLELLLAPNLAEEDDSVWNETVSAIWKGLNRGDTLKRHLPLPIIVKILRGGWLRDGTWPRGMVAPEDENGMGVPEPHKPRKSVNSVTN